MSEALGRARLEEVLHFGRAARASDIHLAAGQPPVHRIDGSLRAHGTVAVESGEILGIVRALLDGSARALLDEAGDVSVRYATPEAGPNRVHAYRGIHGVSLAVRLLMQTPPRLESLHLPAVLGDLAQSSHGLVIVSGPTGSGKSTALAAVIDRINRAQPKHIVTIEDPIEYLHESFQSFVSQREVGRDVATFAAGVIGVLRCDPDVILLGEMRDAATIAAALIAAETGHLVFATMDTGDAVQTIDRIVGSFDGSAQVQARIQLAQSLLAIICTRLVPRARAAGRVPVAEVLLVNDAVRNLIRDARTHQLRNVMVAGRQAGMQTLEFSLADLVLQGEITAAAAGSVTERHEELATAGAAE